MNGKGPEMGELAKRVGLGETRQLRRSASFSGADLKSTPLAGQELAYLDLSGADLCGAKLNGLQLAYVNLAGADLTGADLTGSRWTMVHAAGASLTGADLSGAWLEASALSGADLSGARLQGTRVRSSSLERANLSGARLQQSFVTLSSLYEADLSGAELDDTRWFHNQTVGANLAGAHRFYRNRELVVEILRQALDNDLERAMRAGAVSLLKGWCWDAWIAALREQPEPLQSWVREVFARYPESGCLKVLDQEIEAPTEG